MLYYSVVYCMLCTADEQRLLPERGVERPGAASDRHRWHSQPIRAARAAAARSPPACRNSAPHPSRTPLQNSNVQCSYALGENHFGFGLLLPTFALTCSQIASALPERWQSPDAVLPKEVSESMQPFFKFIAAAIETFASSASAPDISSHAFRYTCTCTVH